MVSIEYIQKKSYLRHRYGVIEPFGPTCSARGIYSGFDRLTEILSVMRPTRMKVAEYFFLTLHVTSWPHWTGFIIVPVRN